MHSASLQITLRRAISFRISSSYSNILFSRALLCRSYATHSSNKPATSSSLLSQALDQRQRAARREDSVGPFQLGLTLPRPDEVGDVKKWSELSTSGKALRATARTTNFAVILFGAGLSVVLIYALTSELFSKNSPTVLYGKACELIKASPKATKYLGEPLVFHNQPPSTVRPRHRNHYVSSQLFRDSAGREHMLMNFYVQGHRPGSEPPSTSESESYLSSAFRRAKESVSALADMSLDDIVQSAKEHADNVFEAARQRFRFLSGDAVPPLPLPAAPKEDVKEKKKEGGWMSGFTGLFSGIKGVARTAAQSDSSDGQLYSEGEVHADLVMNDQGYFEFRYLLIDIPNSNTRNPRRIFIERANGVRETEPVIRWHH